MKTLLHRHLWQRLPADLRRRALFAATSIAAYRPPARVPAREPLIVGGVLRSATGLGESARLCHDALKSAGFDVYGVDLTGALMQPDDLSFDFADARAHRGAGTLILHVNGPLVPLAMLRLGRDFLRDKRVVAYWAWELPRAPDDWKFGAPFVHEIWAPSRFTADAIQPVAAGRLVRVVAHPVAARLGQTRIENSKAPDAERPFTVLTMFDMGSSLARKNPLAAVAAFRKAFGDDRNTRLLVKVLNGDSFAAGRADLERSIAGAANIELIERRLTLDELAALYDRSDALLSLHRAEGFGLPLAEAMLRGVAVIATDWSGNVDFLSKETGFPVPYRLVPASDPQRTYDDAGASWADADVGAAARLLVEARDDAQARRRRVESAGRSAQMQWSAERYAKTVREMLQLP